MGHNARFRPSPCTRPYATPHFLSPPNRVSIQLLRMVLSPCRARPARNDDLPRAQAPASLSKSERSADRSYMGESSPANSTENARNAMAMHELRQRHCLISVQHPLALDAEWTPGSPVRGSRSRTRQGAWELQKKRGRRESDRPARSGRLGGRARKSAGGTDQQRRLAGAFKCVGKSGTPCCDWPP